MYTYIVSQRSGTEIYKQQIALTTPWQLSKYGTFASTSLRSD